MYATPSNVGPSPSGTLVFDSTSASYPPTLQISNTASMLTAVRILGPFAALLIAIAFLVQDLPRSWLPFLLYAGIASLVTLACWPYLWPDPFGRFNDVVRHMADNPQLVPVLFGGRVYSSTDLPASYLPRLLGLTLTEPVWVLALAGLLVGAVRFVRKDLDWRTWFPVLAWFALPTILHVNDPLLPILEGAGQRVFAFSTHPTAEQLAYCLYVFLEKKFPGKVDSVTIAETVNNTATFRR